MFIIEKRRFFFKALHAIIMLFFIMIYKLKLVIIPLSIFFRK
ncbi:hypothetical protein DDD_2528 [Nonlabens dokdonensis DSW-6]|uniref:Uncharacterized protein n=1 Tax=Nonlabens dokdonensis (strain DSM 17205 / KCTC 12402 / DSW-6) TaxID=592029 RepID=L7W7I7_NONDD|nr:hypothetical protein DDD_2528 [Nonlabens dokdonensis DSW-6]